MTSKAETSSHDHALREQLATDGYVVIPEALSITEVEALRKVCAQSISLARQGKWPHIRTLPKQFPPWTRDASQGIWGVQHLLHPDMPGREAYALTYFSDAIVAAVTSILNCEEEQLAMELYNMLVRPDHDFALRWHRDNISSEASLEEEIESLQEPVVHAQWNLALYHDTSLIVIPRSHVRARTDVERHADPYDNDMPGQEVVQLNPGDVVFYNNNILHRGVYDSSTERITLHVSLHPL